MTMKFTIEQVALYPKNPKAAIQLLSEMGAIDWSFDTVAARGTVFGSESGNTAELAFNYDILKGKELEILDYVDGDNWMESQPWRVSHLGMHCTEEELKYWRGFFLDRDIRVAQEVMTESHTNPVIAGKRWYHYVIFDTFAILGVDIKFIVRRDLDNL